ncbi:MAG: sigma 54 modulation/S30EA ribosomal C-terminal domain-containing protein, partial [Paracoccaceae bacterium]
GHQKDQNQSVEFIDPTSYMDATKEGLQDSTISSGPLIVAETDKVFPCLSVIEAAEEIEKSKQPFLLFKSDKKQGVNILFRREDGNLGWIEPS